MTHLEDQLMRHEGMRLHPYRCPSGALTIGVGRNLDANGISRDEAMMMMQNDICRAKRDVESLIDCHGVKKWMLCYARFDVLVNMAFNIGGRSLGGFLRMWAALAAEDYETAADEMLDSQWAREVGHRAVELAKQMKTGEYRK